MITESKYMQGKIIKGIAGFYYVNVVESGILNVKQRVLSKRRNQAVGR